jgi:hypothetical protein
LIYCAHSINGDIEVLACPYRALVQKQKLHRVPAESVPESGEFLVVYKAIHKVDLNVTPFCWCALGLRDLNHLLDETFS